MRVLPVAFAAFGGVAGLFAILALGALRPAALEVFPLAPWLTTAIVGAAVGLALARLHQAGQVGRDLPTEVIVVRTGATSVVGGAVSGGLVGFLTWGPDGVDRFAMGGAIVGLLLQPGCHAVFRAAVRATRARRGSLVADADRRTIVSTLTAGAALLAATQVPALLTLSISSHLSPLVQAVGSLLVCALAVALIVRLGAHDRRGRAALDEASREATWLEPASEEREPTKNALDLGLGDQHFATAARGGYRTQPGEVRLRGSIADAQTAFDECDRARHRALLCATFALVQLVGVVALRAPELLGAP
jgi:hypothetical protein